MVVGKCIGDDTCMGGICGGSGTSSSGDPDS